MIERLLTAAELAEHLAISTSDRTRGLQSGCRDLNSGPSVPQTDALTRLRHTPWRLEP
jgi:hypothetical protein